MLKVICFKSGRATVRVNVVLELEFLIIAG